MDQNSTVQRQKANLPNSGELPEAGSVSFQIYEQLRQEIQSLKDEMSALSEQNVDLAIQLGQIDELNELVASKEQIIRQFAAERANLLTSLADLQKQMINEQNRSQTLEKTLEELTQAGADLQEQLKDAQKQLKSSQAAEADLKAQLEGKQAEINRLNEQLEEQKTANARHLAALESLEVYIEKPAKPNPAPSSDLLRL